MTVGVRWRNNVSRKESSAGNIVGLTVGVGRLINVSRNVSSAGDIVGLTVGVGWQIGSDCWSQTAN